MDTNKHEFAFFADSRSEDYSDTPKAYPKFAWKNAAQRRGYRFGGHPFWRGCGVTNRPSIDEKGAAVRDRRYSNLKRFSK
jgi:hypothetical protein